MQQWVPFALVVIAAGFDLLNEREIPNTISALIFVWSVVAVAFGWQSFGWISAAAGSVVGIIVGFLLFQFAGFGGGDVKLIASLGAVFGFIGELSLLFYMCLAGAVLALIAKARGQNEFGYAPAIAIGVLLVTFLTGR